MRLGSLRMSTQPSTRSGGNRLAEFIARYGIMFVLLIMIIALTVLTPSLRGEQYFLTKRNLLQVALQASINAVIAVGMTFIITSGGIDLSVGSMAGLVGVVTAIALRDYGAGYLGGFVVAVARARPAVCSTAF